MSDTKNFLFNYCLTSILTLFIVICVIKTNYSVADLFKLYAFLICTTNETLKTRISHV